MSKEIVIKVENVSKAYTIWASPSARLHGPILGQIGQMPFLPSSARNFCKRLSRESFTNFYALKDISFEVGRGECLGIVGQNGSGKSTLLQIVAGILEPTVGTVEVHGKITALLELGSGFNPEFTGRENVFLNGSVLGLSASEVRAKFEEIAAFADIGDFIEQPTKTYSSGMTVRLAFAVQAILNQDILIVDEALAVGDEAFQRKCFSRIESFRANGGTILFVSHAAGMVVELCERAILLDCGELLLSGAPKQVVARYHKLLYAPPDRREAIRQEIICPNTLTPSPGGPSATVALQEEKVGGDEAFDPGMVSKSAVSYASIGTTIEDPHIGTLDERRVNVLVRGREYCFTYQAKFSEPAFRLRFGMLIKTVSGFELGGAVTHRPGDGMEFVDRGQVVDVTFKFRCLLQPGVYFLNAGVVGTVRGCEVYLHRLTDVLMFRVQPETDGRGSGIVDFCIESRASIVGEGNSRGQFVCESHFLAPSSPFVL